MSKVALITGASSGIGAEFARQLARQNYNLILIARRKEKLVTLAAELQGKYANKVEVVSRDLSKIEELDHLESELAGRQIDMLVNNAGFGLNESFQHLPIDRILAMMRLHQEAAVRLTKIVSPEMLLRKSGVIINVSSISAFVPAAGSVIYPATKAFLVSFSKSLQKEVEDGGIKVQALCPGFTRSEFHDTPDYKNFDRSIIPKFLWMSAEEVVSHSLKALTGSKVIFIPGFLNRISILLITCPLTAPLFWKIYNSKRKKLK